MIHNENLDKVVNQISILDEICNEVENTAQGNNKSDYYLSMDRDASARLLILAFQNDPIMQEDKYSRVRPMEKKIKDMLESSLRDELIKIGENANDSLSSMLYVNKAFVYDQETTVALQLRDEDKNDKDEYSLRSEFEFKRVPVIVGYSIENRGTASCSYLKANYLKDLISFQKALIKAGQTVVITRHELQLLKLFNGGKLMNGSIITKKKHNDSPVISFIRLNFLYDDNNNKIHALIRDCTTRVNKDKSSDLDTALIFEKYFYWLHNFKQFNRLYAVACN